MLNFRIWHEARKKVVPGQMMLPFGDEPRQQSLLFGGHKGEVKITKKGLRQKYDEAKTRHPGMVVLFRKGDFYELFFDDAEKVSKLLSLPITKKQDAGEIIAMTGFPHSSLESNLRQMLKAKMRVAIADAEE